MPTVHRIEQMLADIRHHARDSSFMTGRETLSPDVLQAMAKVPRERFVPSDLQVSAFTDAPLPIGRGQTISQPFIVALMSDLLDLDAQSRVLEVGTGCGYQTAVLAELAREVYTLEIIPELARAAQARLAGMGYANVHARAADGYHGWAAAAPFDGILVTAAAERVPPPLIEQLAVSASMVIPVGASPFGQGLMLLHKDSAGKVSMRNVLPVAFVPLTGDH